ncbi:hypothetical protein HPP92_017857 [Vanilla planifolia]|uniref:EIF3F/CSN6-like C-terminal domain-containing protein n=1 Tax=Vanilla planifolia TaxID=51239 RepID=A0A835QBP4_VANPL|nr:hypothetical protein HPP92_017857 [Vanilla planifolia]
MGGDVIVSLITKLLGVYILSKKRAQEDYRKEGDVPLENSLLRQVSSFLRRLPAIESEKFQDDFLMEINDTLLMSYLAMFTNCTSTMNELVEKFNTMEAHLAEVDGPFVKLRLQGRFWHKRETVLARLANYLKSRIPDVLEVDIEDEKQLDDSPENF